ncbi:CarD family transcriptional regulator [Rickettsiales endosymbiont of Paramecium tredecaurelia]|uniref:CarD family transcriptional regulator n=1 Tax=Candidatus Sarmatiella mevalonica TaxID=2770581 RepID=UPI001921C982|nr:CarD family transcriptional regulator [Candidatus Sarmatiella mevalonica]MBL3285308.1 CarD family transcriptional regulator [Candidatus Sarmatiella mevalonica]
MNKKFEIGEQVVYPAHGVGKIVNIESQKLGDIELEVYAVFFEAEKMTLKVPVDSAQECGLRKLADRKELTKMYKTLQSQPKQGSRMWSRRAQEYESKIHSGDILAIAEVLCALYKNALSDRSFSERSIYELALHRLAQEVAVLEKISMEDALEKLVCMLRDRFAA